MNEQKILIKLDKQAESIKEVESSIPQSQITEMPLEDFYNLKGDKISLDEGSKTLKTRVIFSISDNAYYKKQDKEWFKYKPEKEQTETLQEKTEEIPENEAIKEELKKSINQIRDWITELKPALEKTLDKFKERISILEVKADNIDLSCKESLEELRKYIDLKIKSKKKGEKNGK